MTVSTGTRARLTAIIAEYRTTWQTAGINAAILEASRQHPNDDLLVIAKAVAAARDVNARTPAAMLNVDLDKPATVTSKPAPRPTDPKCDVCCSTIRDPNGQCVGCQQERQGGHPAGIRIGTSSGPSAEQRALIAAAIGPQARRSVASNVRPPTDQKENQ